MQGRRRVRHVGPFPFLTLNKHIRLRFTIIFSKKKTGNAQEPTIYDCRGANPKHNDDDRGRLTKICLETERHLKNGQQDAKMAITMTHEDKDTDKDK